MAAAAGMAYMLNSGLTAQERAECARWSAEAREYPNYYMTAWQREQCGAVAVRLTSNQ